jgi:hypothetical protein
MQTMAKQSRSIIDFLSEVEDERRDNANREHELVDILVIALCGMLSGADDWVCIAQTSNILKILRTPIWNAT